MTKIFTWKASNKIRLSSFLKERLNNEYNSHDISQIIQNQRCLVNKKIEKFESTNLSPNDEIIVFPKKFPKIEFDPKRVLFNHPDYIIYNKPPYISTEQLAKVLKLHVVHRLDRDTTGCIIFSKSLEASPKLFMLFKKKLITKQYLAFVSKAPTKNVGIIKSFLYIKSRRQGALTMSSSPTKGKLSITQWKCLKKTFYGAVLMCSPLTGRTHQIRVHLYSYGFPIIGDTEYQNPINDKYFSFRYLLHASSLSFVCPFSQAKISISSQMEKEPIFYFSKEKKIKFLSI